MKLITILDARPKFIRAAPFFEVFRGENQEILIHTGHHYDSNMSDVFFEELGIPKPEYNLGVGFESHGQQTGRMLEKIEEIIIFFKKRNEDIERFINFLKTKDVVEYKFNITKKNLKHI